MSMGGDFYALSDDQLQRMLEGSLDYAEFLYGEIEEKPRECYSRGEHLWYELTRLLQNEDACGMEQTDAIPEFSGYSWSGDVASTAKRLTALSEDQIRHRHDDENIEAPIGALLETDPDLHLSRALRQDAPHDHAPHQAIELLS